VVKVLRRLFEHEADALRRSCRICGGALVVGPCRPLPDDVARLADDLVERRLVALNRKETDHAR